MDSRLSDLIRWGRLFHELGCAPSYESGSHGNLSVRTQQGCLITATQTFLGALEESHFVELVGCDLSAAPPTVLYRGKRPPSTDSLIHWQIYRWRKEVECVLHAHDSKTLTQADRLGLPQTTCAADAGSPELVPLIQPLAHHPYFLVREHGFVATGKTIEEAGQLAVSIHRRAAEVS